MTLLLLVLLVAASPSAMGDAGHPPLRIPSISLTSLQASENIR
jgi:hypothetical protein